MKESEIQRQCLEYLLLHPAVAWAKVNTTGVFKGRGGSRIRIGIPGESDIIGQLKDGRVIAIEVKQPGEKPSQAQEDFLKMVYLNNGVSNWVTTLEELQATMSQCANISAG